MMLLAGTAGFVIGTVTMLILGAVHDALEARAAQADADAARVDAEDQAIRLANPDVNCPRVVVDADAAVSVIDLDAHITERIDARIDAALEESISHHPSGGQPRLWVVK